MDSLNEEYKQAFRTNSYIEICNKVQDHLVGITCLDEASSAASSSSPPLPPSSLLPSPPPTQNFHLSDSSNPHHPFLVNYFEISLEASRICESILTSIHQVRSNHRRIKKVIQLIKRLPDSSNPTDDEYHVLYENLASFASRRNSFSTMSPQKFQELHETHARLFQELTSKCRKLNRRKKIIKLIKRTIASFLVLGCGSLAIILLILAMHCMVGLVAAPGLVMWSTMVIKKKKRTERRCSKECLEVKLDIAARGVYIMINEFATMSQIVKRLRDELERRKHLAGICVGKGKNEMFKKVVREFQMHESWFVEELEELEKQICLCFLDINRSRRLLVREMSI